MTRRRVLVTRPAQEARRWVQALQERGIDALALPLLAIEPVRDEPGLRHLREVQGRAMAFDAWMFVSSAAVEHFVREELASASGPRCWATGPGTAAALREAGVPGNRIDVPTDRSAQFDSEALWQIVQAQVRAGMRVLFVRGGDEHGQPAGRDWLSRQVADAGADQETVVAYMRMSPAWTDEHRRVAQSAASDGSVWLFSSSQAIANLQMAAPSCDWSGALAIATHPRIARTAEEAGFGRVVQSSAALDGLVASIESLQ